MAVEYRLPDSVAFSNTPFAETGLYQLQSSGDVNTALVENKRSKGLWNQTENNAIILGLQLVVLHKMQNIPSVRYM